MTDYYQESISLHKKLRVKIEITNKSNVISKEDLAVVYSPGVAQPCIEIKDDPEKAYAYTIKGNTVAVITDGSAVLGLGNIGAKAVIFALANPQPEIMPEEALKGGAAIVATGRSDYPNQVNNVLVFPGIFRGALDGRAKRITPEMKLAAAYALADCIENPSKENIIPSSFDENIAKNVANSVANASSIISKHKHNRI